MAVRNSLMNAGNPIFTAFAMERVTAGERATLVGRHERPVAGRLDHRRPVVRGTPGDARLRGRLHRRTSSRSSRCTRSRPACTGSGSGRSTGACWPCARPRERRRDSRPSSVLRDVRAGRRAGRLRPWQRRPAPQRAKTAIPRNPGRHELGMQAKLLFPDKDIVDRFYVPLIYTACRTCYSELEPQEIFRRAIEGEIDSASMQRLIARRHRVGARLHDRAHRVHVRLSRRVADAVAPARAPPGGRRLRPAEPALRQVQGRGDDAAGDDRRGRRRAARALRGAGRGALGPVRRAASRRACPARTRGSCSPTRRARTW